MAVYDFTQKKIFGCKEGSFVWWHEKGHQIIHELGISAYLSAYKYWFLLATIAFLIVGKPYGAVIPFLIIVSLDFSEELAAWGYAFKMRGKKITECDF